MAEVISYIASIVLFGPIGVLLAPALHIFLIVTFFCIALSFPVIPKKCTLSIFVIFFQQIACLRIPFFFPSFFFSLSRVPALLFCFSLLPCAVVS